MTQEVIREFLKKKLKEIAGNWGIEIRPGHTRDQKWSAISQISLQKILICKSGSLAQAYLSPVEIEWIACDYELSKI